VRIDKVWVEHQRHLVGLHGLLGLALQHIAAGEVVVSIGKARFQGDSLRKCSWAERMEIVKCQ